MADAARGTKKGEKECGGVPTWHCHEGGEGGVRYQASREWGAGCYPASPYKTEMEVL